MKRVKCKRQHRIRGISSVLPGCALLFGHSVLAQPIEEVVVTATKRGTTLIQDTPFSVQSIGGDYIREMGALEFDDFFRQVPGLSMSDNGPGDKRIVIRGVSSPGYGTVGVYFDEIVMTGEKVGDEGGRQPDIKLFDIDRIEVLRGPQGTTFGSNSLSGAIRYLPNRPDFVGFSAATEAKIQTVKESDDMGWQVDGMINMPFGDRVAVRLSGLLLESAGYIDNRFERDANSEDTGAARAMLTWRITDDLELSLLSMYQDMDINARSSYTNEDYDLALSPTLNGDPMPNSFYSNSLSRTPRSDEIDMHNLKLIYARGWGSITATASHFDRSSLFARDSSAAVEVLSRGRVTADGAGRSNLIGGNSQETFSGELRFASNWNSAAQVLLGSYYQDEDRVNESLLIAVDGATGTPTENSQVFQDQNQITGLTEFALFGEVSWELTDRFTVVGGLRWFESERDQTGTRRVDFMSVPGPGAGVHSTSDEDGTTFKVNLAHEFRDDILGYLQVAEGYRSGGTNDLTIANAVGVAIPAGYESDSLTNYEIGVKTASFDDKLIANVAVYYTDWSNIQVNQFAVQQGTGIQLAYRGNGGKAEVYGSELEISAFPTAGSQLNVGLSYIHQAELAEDLPIPRDGLEGDDIPYVPELSATVGGRYEWPLGRDAMKLFLGGDWSYVDEQTNRLRPANRFFRVVEAYDILNLRSGVEGEDWSLVLRVDNALDADDVIAYQFDFLGPAPAGGTIPDPLGRPWPRTISVAFRKSFEF